MPSHTFVALGLWTESNATNERALASEPPATAGYDENFHEIWFLEYGYLQTGETAKAKTMAQHALAVYNDAVVHYHDVDADTASDRYDMDEMLYAVFAYGMETGDYAMTPATSDDGIGPRTTGARMEYAVMQALAAKDAATARSRDDALLAFDKADAVQSRRNVSGDVDIEAYVADGEVRIANGDTAGGLASLARAAKEEAAAGDISQPLEMLPAEETYGRELLRLGRFAEAEQQLRAALALTPHRTQAASLLALAQAHRRS
jgi:tetratricopeptide (TPR) repeat protein